ncbi:MAG TPA: hypothetical protein VH593_14360 [Ktedonobacteraceae bacterium]|jgi:hypothetical protein
MTIDNLAAFVWRWWNEYPADSEHEAVAAIVFMMISQAGNHGLASILAGIEERCRDASEARSAAYRQLLDHFNDSGIW